MTIADINTLARFLTSTDTVSYTAAQLLIAVNASYERVTGKIISEIAGRRWQYGDFNYTAFPTFTISMSDGVQSYDLNDISTRPLTIMGLEVLDQSGNPHVLRRTSLKEIHKDGTAFDDYQSTNGLPNEFEIRDNLIVLYPAPATANVTLTNGLIIYYLRTADVFTSAQVSTGTKQPGFPSPWHDILAYESAWLFGIKQGLPNANTLFAEVQRKEKEMIDFITRQDQQDDPRFAVNTKSFL